MSTLTPTVLAAGPTAAPLDQPATLTVVDMVWPDQSNHHGTLFGGAALSMLDRMAFIAGSKVLRGEVVTGAVGQLNFHAPAPAGHVVECRVHTTRRGRRSVTLQTVLTAEDLLSGARTTCLSGEFTMVRKADGQDASAHGDMPPESLDASLALQPMASAMVAEIVFPGHANHRSVLHGGPAMEWMAKAGFVAATRQVRRPVVLARSGQMDFNAPAHVGDVVEVSAQVHHVGQRSVHVRTTMWAESPVSGERRHCTTGELVFVALDR